MANPPLGTTTGATPMGGGVACALKFKAAHEPIRRMEDRAWRMDRCTEPLVRNREAFGVRGACSRCRTSQVLESGLASELRLGESGSKLLLPTRILESA